MIEKESFTRPINTDISVATIGINRDQWYCCKPGMTRNEVKATMLLEKYDVVPIEDKNRVFKSYFTLDKSNNNKPKINKIEPSDRLYYLTHVRDAIWKMKTEQKTHYFLTNGRNENDIVGLLSLSNYNCREFYVYLFSLMSYIEREFASLIKSDKDTGMAILRKLSVSQELKDQLDVIEKRMTEDKDRENENDYKEYLYLHHLIWLVKEEKNYKLLGYRNEGDFETGTGGQKGKGGLKELRNNIAHPVKSLVQNLQDLDNLDKGLSKLYEFKERLDNFLKSDS